MRRPWRLVSIAVLGAAALGGALAGDRLLALTGSTRDNLRVFSELLDAAHSGYGREVRYRDLVYAGIHGMLRTLDPHTAFLAPEAHAQMRERHQASFYGLGILVGQRNGRLTVITPIEGTPASQLGIRAGDIIHLIEGEPTAKMTVDEAVSKLKGPKGTEVHITILRSGLPEPLELTVVRAEIPQSTVRYAYMIEPGTGYLSITDFSRSTGDEVARALELLREQGMERLILDLRNNGGGLLDQAIEVSDQFLPKGSAIVETRGRVRDSMQAFDAAGRHPDFALPLVVLVNTGTASAAEIVSGAIQDHDIGLVVGTPTWGKGLVQTVYNLSYGAGLALTTAKYYTPSGRLIQRDYNSFYDYYARTDLVDDPAGEGDDAELPEAEGEAAEGGGEPAERYSTDLGRTVYGGGGITPDVEVEPKELAPALQFLLARAAFLRFAIEWADRNPGYGRDWRPDDSILAEFGEWLNQQEIETSEQTAETFADPENRAFALRQIRGEALGAKFGIQASHQAFAEGDAQIRAAFELFPKAAMLLSQRKGLDVAPDVRTADTLRH